jgi:hypothetical protein
VRDGRERRRQDDAAPAGGRRRRARCGQRDARRRGRARLLRAAVASASGS